MYNRFETKFSLTVVFLQYINGQNLEFDLDTLPFGCHMTAKVCHVELSSQKLNFKPCRRVTGSDLRFLTLLTFHIVCVSRDHKTRSCGTLQIGCGDGKVGHWNCVHM